MLNKLFSLVALLSALVGSAYAQDAEPPDLANARVTIPYSELKELWRAAQQKNQSPAKPPIAAALLSARYDLELRGDQLTGFIEFETQSFTDGWTLLPLIDDGVQVDKIEPPAASVIVRDGAYNFLTNRAGKQQIKVHFTVALVSAGETARVALSSSSALVNLNSIHGIPADKTLQIANATPLAADKGMATFRSPPQQPLELRFAPKTNAAPIPSEWQITTQALAHFEDDVLRYEAHLSATTNGGSALGLKLKLPANTRVMSVNGEDLAAWRAEDAVSDSRVVVLQWRTPNIRQRQIDFTYELSQPAEGEWQLQAPEAVDGKTLPAIFAVTANASLGLTVTEKSEEPPTAPRWLSERIATSPNVAVTRGAAINARLRPVVEVAPAIVESATFNTRVVSDGSLISEQIYNIRAQTALSWSVQLPEKSELLSCAIDDRRINPIDRGNGALEIPISGSSNAKPVRVALAYTSRTAAFQPVSGRLKIELPKTPLLISVLDWDLAIPAEYEVAALEGNVGPGAGVRAREGSTVVHLKKELCRNERPAVELFYQKPEVKK